MRTLIRQSLVFFAVMTVLTGVLYPLVVTGVTQLAFPSRANGSVIDAAGRQVGSTLIGQDFTSMKYFWTRPSATTPPYNAASSTGSNLAPTNPAEADLVAKRAAQLEAADPLHRTDIPSDLLTASGSGLDPDITPAAAHYEVARVAAARGLSESAVDALVTRMTAAPFLGVIGEPRVNVLELNLALDRMSGHGGS
jgi:potassium-transporting ATPase KdpC subunit